ncbi:MAG: polysaccharide deacetylase family protein [Oscillospiraceae bacterium]|nr:polysaccharide deacetylase family protein [Oscillospiraceae bacterium]
MKLLSIKILYKTAAIALVCLMTIAMTSCGGGSSKASSQAVASEAVSSEPQDTAEESEASSSQQESEPEIPTENDKQTTFGTVLVTGDKVNIRAEAKSDAKVTGRAAAGTVLALLKNRGEDEEFYKVSYGGKEAYIAASVSTQLSGTGVQAASKGEKLIALTFDDGPDKNLTPQLLDILKSEEVQATFFVLGSAAKVNPSVIKRAAEEGHQIASHTYNHKDLTSISEAKLKSEINDTAKVIEQNAGSKPIALRPPYGAYNAAVLNAVDVNVIIWSIDPMDWKFKDAEIVYQNVVNVARDGDIVLMHDVHASSVEAMKSIIPALKLRGFSFVTIEKLIELRSTPAHGKVYNDLRNAA